MQLRIAPTFLLLVLAGTSQAVVITTGDGTGNTTAPTDDPGFANVAVKGDSAVYLGDGWVATAAHSGAGGITLGGVPYAMVPGSAVTIPFDESTLTDLQLFQIESPPSLPSVVIAKTAPQVGEAAVLIGNGNNRSVAKTYWDASWVEVSPPGFYSGWKQIGGRTIRWGTNVITLVDVQADVSGTSTIEFGVDFDDLVDEAQAVNGDSGGAVFVKRGGVWELAGIMNLASQWPGQPVGTEVFGNRTFAIDLHEYRFQIMLLISPNVPSMSAAWLLAAAILVGLAGIAVTRSLAFRR